MTFKKNISWIFIVSFLVAVVISCVESGTNPNATVTLKIVWPETGDSVEVGENTIQYEVTNPMSIGFEEFYVSINGGESVESFEAVDNSNGTELLLNVDSVYLNQEIEYFIQVKTTDENYHSSSVQKNIYVGEQTNPPEGGSIVLTLSKFNTGNQTNYSVLLEWEDTLSSIEEYEIWKSEGSNSEYGDTPYKTVASSIERYEDYNLSRFQIYYYKVRAVNKYGNSDYSNEVSTSDDPDEAPTNLVAEAIGATKIKLTWDDNAIPKIGYKIERSSSDSDGFQLIEYIPGTHTEYTDNYKLSPSTTYCYRVQSVTNTNSSEYSETACADTWEEDVDSPQDLTAVFDQSTRSVVITWADISNGSATGTVIERSNDDGESFIQIASVDDGVQEYYDTYSSSSSSSIQERTTYIYRAYHTAGTNQKTDYSNEDNVAVPVFKPFAPANVSRFFDDGTDFSIQWEWEDEIDIDYYLIQYWPTPYGNSRVDPISHYYSPAINGKFYIGRYPSTSLDWTLTVRAVRVVDQIEYLSEISIDTNNENIVLEIVNDKEIITINGANNNEVLNITYSGRSIASIEPTLYHVERKSGFSDYVSVGYFKYNGTSTNITDSEVSTLLGQTYRVRAIYFDSANSAQFYSPPEEKTIQ